MDINYVLNTLYTFTIKKIVQIFLDEAGFNNFNIVS